MYVHIYTDVRVYRCIYIYVYTFIYVYIHIYVYVYICTQSYVDVHRISKKAAKSADPLGSNPSKKQ